MGGKTGTPERLIQYIDDFDDPDKFNDAWYLCYVGVKTPGSGITPSKKGYIAIALRLERTYKFQSGEAANFISRVVVPALEDAGYDVLETMD